MKSLLKKSILVFAFAFAFILGGAVAVKAAGAINNTKISGVTSYSADGDDYYVAVGKAEDVTITLSSKSNGEKAWDFLSYSVKPYTAKVAVVRCETYNAGSGECNGWKVKYFSDDEVTTMDNLKKGLTLSFREADFQDTGSTPTVMGANLSQLHSVYGSDKTYFVLVQYTLKKTISASVTYDPDMFRVVFSDTTGIAGLNITASKSGATASINVTSGFPINTIRYFHKSSEVAQNYDFSAEYDAAGAANQVITLETAQSNPQVTNGKFSYGFDIGTQTGEYYYIEATDIAGNRTIYDLTNGTQDTNAPVNAKDNGDVSNTIVGKIILISLVVVLVLSLVLVIIQKIVDYRKKLY